MTWYVLGVVAWVGGSKCPRDAVNRAGRWVSVSATSGFPDEADCLSHGRVFKIPVTWQSHSKSTESESQGCWDPLLPTSACRTPSWLTLSGKGLSAILEWWRAPEYKVIVLESENSQGSESGRIYERVTEEG